MLAGEASPEKHPGPKFCAAPWTEAVLKMTGEVNPCCRSGFVYGNFQIDSLADVWRSDAASAFRQSIIDGAFPDQRCADCWANGAAGRLERALGQTMHDNWQIIARVATEHGIRLPPPTVITDFRAILAQTHITPEIQAVIDRFMKFLGYFRGILWTRKITGEGLQALCKLELVTLIAMDFLSANLTPSVVAPFRQVQLQAVCNARCIQCFGLFTGEISDGQLMPDGTRLAAMHADLSLRAFAHPNDIVDFFMNGSEFMMFRKWQDIATLLYDTGVKFSLSTNGILLTRRNIDFLFERHRLSNLNISLDGATKETIEAVRVNVKYDHLIRNLDYLFDVCERQATPTRITISFCLMRCNYTELPALFALLATLRRGRNIDLSVSIHLLDAMEEFGYWSFRQDQDISTIDEATLHATLTSALTQSHHHTIPAFMLYTTPLETYLTPS